LDRPQHAAHTNAKEPDMTISSHGELNKLRDIGKIVHEVLLEMAAAVRPGTTTATLDAVGASMLAKHGAESSPPKVYQFPGAVCISVNEEAVHGIPGDRVINEGDLVKLDLTAEKDGFVADSAITVRVGKVTAEAESLARCAESAFNHALHAAQPGNRVNEIGRAVSQEVRHCGFSVIKALCGHGVGRSIHEDPCVPNHYDPRFRSKMHEGLVLTIEPIIAAGRGDVVLEADKWTIRTADRSLSAHYEHTMVITKGGPILVTAA